MLFKQVTLDAIKSGAVTLAFRKWKQARAKTGSLIKTAVGLVSIGEIRVIEASKITKQQAVRAGYKDLAALLKMLDQIPEGNIYTIAVQYHAPDPRLVLRQQEHLSKEAFTQLHAQVNRLDQYSKTGHWTAHVLSAIAENPMLRAADLALKTGREKDWLKLNIHKLKNLGLTISHNPGYELSPLGEAYRNHLLHSNTHDTDSHL